MYEYNRRASVLIARIRCDNANLNAHLFRRGLVDLPLCSCGTTIETTHHYLI